MTSPINRLRGQRVLITGAAGFLGQRLVARLTREQAEIHAVSRRPSNADDSEIQWWKGNLADEKWTHELITKLNPSVVYHLTSASMGGQELNHVLPTFEDDLRTTVNVLTACARVHCSRVLITGSLDEPIPNGDLKSPSSPYAAAKACAGLYARMFHRLYGLPVVIMRPFMTYGPGQKSHKVIPHAITAMLRGISPKLSSGTRLVDWVYVDDVIDGFAEAAIRPEAVGVDIDLGSGHLVSIREVMLHIRDLIPGAPEPEFGALSDRIGEQTRSADLTTAKHVLDWEASTPLREGLSRTIEWCRNAMALAPVGVNSSGAAKESQL
jgi:UDP-glucose 4-epimerase